MVSQKQFNINCHSLTAGQVWEMYVGSQTEFEFMKYSVFHSQPYSEEEIETAVKEYCAESQMNWNDEDLQRWTQEYHEADDKFEPQDLSEIEDALIEYIKNAFKGEQLEYTSFKVHKPVLDDLSKVAPKVATFYETANLSKEETIQKLIQFFLTHFQTQVNSTISLKTVQKYPYFIDDNNFAEENLYVEEINNPWFYWVGNQTIAEFLKDETDIPTAVKKYVESMPRLLPDLRGRISKAWITKKLIEYIEKNK